MKRYTDYTCSYCSNDHAGECSVERSNLEQCSNCKEEVDYRMLNESGWCPGCIQIALEIEREEEEKLDRAA